MDQAADLLVYHLRALVAPSRQDAVPDGQLLARWADQHDGQAFATLV